MSVATEKVMPYRQLYRELHDQIVAKTLTGKLPSIAVLAAHYRVNHNTVKKALGQLKEHRFIYAEQGKGSFVNPDGAVNVLAQKFVTLYIHASLQLNPFYMQLIFALRTLLEAERCNVNLVNTLSQQEAFATQTDVLLLFEQFEPEELEQVERFVPRERILCCNCRGPAGCRQVGTDNAAGGELAMRYLYGLGHRKIGVLRVLDCDDERSHFFWRWQGVLRFAAAHPDLTLHEVAIPAAALNGAIGTRWIAALYEQGGEPDAVFVFMDLLALGVYQFMAERGVRCAVLGHDDRDFAAQLFPALSSIREDVDRIAAATRRLICDTLDGSVSDDIALIPPQVIERASTQSNQ